MGILSSANCGGGQGGGRPWEKEGSGIPKVVGSRTKREKLLNIAQYFAIKKLQRGGSQGWEPGLKGTESGRFNPPAPNPPPQKKNIALKIK